MKVTCEQPPEREEKECLTVGQLIEQLKKLPQDKKIHCLQWYKRNSDIMRHGCYAVKVYGIEKCVEMDTNKVEFAIDTECKTIDELIEEPEKNADEPIFR